MRKQLIDRTFDRENFKAKYGLNTGPGDRRVRKWLNEIAAEISQTTPEELTLLKKYCIENLTKKAAKHKLDSATELKIVLAGEPREVKVKQEITEHKTVNVNVKALLSEYADLFPKENDENDGSQEATVSNNNPA